MTCAGIDAGSRMVKAVLWDSKKGVILASGAADQGVDYSERAESLVGALLEQAGLERGDLARRAATGYGRNTLKSADAAATEITCQAIGVRRVVPDARAIIDIGGQDSKVIRLSMSGKIADFHMNDRCAAGTGRFLEMLAVRLGVTLDNLGGLAQQSTHPAPISSMCVVFAETEIVGLLASGEVPADIVAGVQAAIAARVATMARRTLESPVAFTGGVALIAGMKESLENALQRAVVVSPQPLFTGALGAAILAADQASGPSSQHRNRG